MSHSDVQLATWSLVASIMQETGEHSYITGFNPQTVAIESHDSIKAGLFDYLFAYHEAAVKRFHTVANNY